MDQIESDVERVTEAPSVRQAAPQVVVFSGGWWSTDLPLPVSPAAPAMPVFQPAEATDE